MVEDANKSNNTPTRVSERRKTAPSSYFMQEYVFKKMNKMDKLSGKPKSSTKINGSLSSPRKKLQSAKPAPNKPRTASTSTNAKPSATVKTDTNTKKTSPTSTKTNASPDTTRRSLKRSNSTPTATLLSLSKKQKTALAEEKAAASSSASKRLKQATTPQKAAAKSKVKVLGQTTPNHDKKAALERFESLKKTFTEYKQREMKLIAKTNSMESITSVFIGAALSATNLNNDYSDNDYGSENADTNDEDNDTDSIIKSSVAVTPPGMFEYTNLEIRAAIDSHAGHFEAIIRGELELSWRHVKYMSCVDRTGKSASLIRDELYCVCCLPASLGDAHQVRAQYAIKRLSSKFKRQLQTALGAKLGNERNLIEYVQLVLLPELLIKLVLNHHSLFRRKKEEEQEKGSSTNATTPSTKTKRRKSTTPATVSPEDYEQAERILWN